jgi:hypothetical protein
MFTSTVWSSDAVPKAALITSLLLCSPALARAAPEGRTLAAFLLPTRSPDGARLATRLREVAEKSGLRVVIYDDGGAPLALSQSLARARERMRAGAFDEAARLFDDALEAGARAPHRITDGASFITGHVLRTSIALARGEVGKARLLLARALTYDPTLALDPAEKNPQLAMVFEGVRRQLGTEPLVEGGDLGEACRAASIVLIGRGLSDGSLLIDRFDRCRKVAEAKVSASDPSRDEQAIAPLTQVEAPTDRPSAPPPPAPPPRWGRGPVIAGALLVGLGAGLTGAGLYFAVDAAQRHDHLQEGCTVSTPCDGATVRDRKDGYDRATIAGAVLAPVGVAVLVAGTVLTVVGVKHRRVPAVSLGGGSRALSLAGTLRF